MITSAGDSLFARARNLEEDLGVRRIYLKFEGSNPTGTQKDRVAQAHYLDAHEKGFSTITVATCGNFGAALAYACSGAAPSGAASSPFLRPVDANGIRPVIFVPGDYHGQRIAEMEKWGARVVRAPGDYEAAVAASKAAAREYGWYDANPGDDNWEIARKGYGRIAREIFESLGRVPDTVAVSVGNGTTLAAVHDGFRELVRDGLATRVPKMVAASTPRGNPIIKSFKKGFRSAVDLAPTEVRETAVNEPLTNWHSFDGDRALAALYDTEGGAYYASDAEMRRLATLVREHEGINVLTASCAALHGLARFAKDRALHEDGLHVAVLTGRQPPRAKPSVPHAATQPAAAPAGAATAPRLQVKAK